MDLTWIKDIEWEKELKGEMREVADLIGIDNLIKLWQAFGKTHIYFSEEPLMRLKKNYIRKYHRPGRTKELARLLNTSEVFVQQAVMPKGSSENQGDLFKQNLERL